MTTTPVQPPPPVEMPPPPPSLVPASRARSPRTTSLVGALLEAPAPPPHVAHPMLAGSALLAAASSLDALQASPWWVLAGAGITTVTAPLVANARLLHGGREALFAGAAAATAGGWLTWTTATTPWAAPQLGTLAVAATVFGPIYGVLRWRRDVRNRKAVEARAVAREHARRKVWEQILARAGAKDVRVGDEDPFGAGIKMQLVLGPNAPDYRSLSAMTPSIERIAANVTGLPIRAGSIQILREEGMMAHQAVMIVPTRDVLSELIALPQWHGARSINDPIVTGQYVDGNAVEVVFRGFHGMFAGMTNFGKSVLLDVHLTQLVRCPDNVTFALAGNKSIRWFRPWLMPWLDGRADRPPIDWVAGDIHESLLVLLDIYRALDGRQGMPNNGNGSWHPTPENPQITVLIDESTDLLESTVIVKTHKGEKVTFADLLLKIVRLGRSEAIQILFCSQRGTASLLGGSGGDLKSQVSYRVGFAAKGNMTDVNAVFSTDTVGIDLSLLPKGAWYVEMEGYERPRLAKGYMVDADRVSEYAIEATQFVGGVDQATADCMEHYAGRWTRPNQVEFLEKIYGGPLRPEIIQTLAGFDPTVRGIIAQAEAGDPGAQQLVEFAEKMADHQRTTTPPADGSDIPDDDSDLIARMRAWGDREAASREALDLEQLWEQDTIGDDQRNTAPAGPVPADTAALITALATEGVLYSGEEWIYSADVRAIAVKHLGWPDNSEGDRQITAALAEVGIKSKRQGAKRLTAYPVAALQAVARRLNAGE